MTVPTEGGGFCLWESESHYGMPERALGIVPDLAVACLGKNRRQGKGRTKVVWGEASIGKQREKGMKGAGHVWLVSILVYACHATGHPSLSCLLIKLHSPQLPGVRRSWHR